MKRWFMALIVFYAAFAFFLAAEGAIYFRGSGLVSLSGSGRLVVRSIILPPAPDGDQTATMTASDTPSPNAVNQDSFASTYFGWKAFDHASNTYWASNKATATWVVYDFGSGNEKAIQRVKYQYFGTSGSSAESKKVKDFVVNGSNDAAAWTTLHSATTRTNDWSEQAFSFSNSTPFRYYQFVASTTRGGLSYKPQASEIQFWASSYNEARSTASMTATSTPSPNCVTESSYYSGVPGWKAFDGSTSTNWQSNVNGTGWLKFDFGLGNGKTIKYVKILADLGANTAPKNITLEGSNNDSTYTQIAAGQYQQDPGYWQGWPCANEDTYRYYRFTVTDVWGGASYKPVIYEIELLEAP